MRIFEGFQKGVNLGGWLSQFDEYDHNHFKTFITEKDFADIAALGVDHVRVPVDYNVIENDDWSIKESGYEYIEQAIKWCKKYNLHLLLDIHEVYGYSFDPLKKDMDREAFFYDEVLQERFFVLWENLAKHFGKYSDIVAFELLNEIVLEEVYSAWNKVADKAIRRIRKIAPDTYIVVGGVCYNNVTSVQLLDAPYDDKIVYNFHCYDPLIFTHQKAYWLDGMPDDLDISYPDDLENYRQKSEKFAKECMGAIFSEKITCVGPELFEALFSTAIEASKKNNAPLYCGEYGVIDRTEIDDALRWLKDINSVFIKYNIGRCLWNYKGKDFGLVDEHFGPYKEQIAKLL